MVLADNNNKMLQDAVCMFAFGLHNSVTNRIWGNDKEWGETETHWTELTPDSNVITLLQSKWGQRDECAAS